VRKAKSGLLTGLAAIFLMATSGFAQTSTPAKDMPADGNLVQQVMKNNPWEMGVAVQGGLGLTEDRNDFKFLMAGGQLGKVLTGPIGPGILRGQFEYGGALFPFWQSYTPKFQRANCTLSGQIFTCSPLFNSGGTYSGIQLMPIILRWNFVTRSKRFQPWFQGAGGVLWTNHKYPGFGSPELTMANDGPNTDASVFNFTPQAGVGFHYFVKPRRSLDFEVNAVHISSASLGDRNPGVNASLQFWLGYTWWKK